MDKIFKCNECNYVFSCSKRLEKHNWEFHPKNDYEKTWSEMKKNGTLYKYSLGFQDDPYY